MNTQPGSKLNKGHQQPVSIEDILTDPKHSCLMLWALKRMLFHKDPKAKRILDTTHTYVTIKPSDSLRVQDIKKQFIHWLHTQEMKTLQDGPARHPNGQLKHLKLENLNGRPAYCSCRHQFAHQPRQSIPNLHECNKCHKWNMTAISPAHLFTLTPQSISGTAPLDTSEA